MRIIPLVTIPPSAMIVVPPLIFFFVCALMQPTWVITTFIIAGHVHFLTTFFHQARIGVVTWRYALVALALVCLALIYFTLWGSFEPVLLLSAFLFGIHIALGEFQVRKEAMTPAYVTSIIAFVGSLLYIIVGIIVPTYQVFFVPILLGTSVLLIARVFFVHTSVSAGERYLWFLILLVLFVGGVLHAPVNAFGALLLAHIYTWTAYGARLANTHNTWRRYWGETVLSLICVCVLFVLYAKEILPLGALFAPAAYYAWTIGHFVLTARLPFLRPRS